MQLVSTCVYLQAVYRKHDEDGSGNFNSYELRQALNTIGNKLAVHCEFDVLIIASTPGEVRSIVMSMSCL